METTPKQSVYFRECCPFYYLWKSEWYFYNTLMFVLCGNFYSCVKTVNFGFVHVAATTWFFTAAASTRLRGRLLLTAATLEAFLLNTSMLWLFENALKMWEVERKGTTVLLPLLLEPTLSLHFLKLICHACPNRPSDTSLLCQTHSRLSTCFWCKDPDGFPNAFQNGLNPESSVSGKTVDGGVLVMPECTVKTSLSPQHFSREKP